MIYIDSDDFDCSPRHMEILLRLKEKLPDLKITLFTIVGKCFDRIVDFKNIDWIDMVPHGWLHPTPRECENWSFEDSDLYLSWVSVLGLTKGFKAPGWQISNGMYKALIKHDYWVADQPYNNNRRPVNLPAYIITNPNIQIHCHMESGMDNDILPNLDRFALLKNESCGFIKDLMSR